MTIKKIVLHIGMEKTGSTSIQNTFAENRDRLRSANCLYPISLGAANHTKLALYASSFEPPFVTRFLNVNTENEFENWRIATTHEFFQELDGSNEELLVLSCEWLAHRIVKEKEFKRLLGLLSSVTENISIVMYIRRQDQLAVSRYTAALWAGESNEFKFPVNPDAQAGIYNFNSIYEKWREYFSDIHVRIFERTAFHKQNLLSDFCHVCGLDYAQVCVDGDTRTDNQSFSEDGQILLREFNKLVLDTVLDGTRLQPVRNYRELVGRIHTGKHLPCKRSEAMKFASMFEESNEMLKSKCFPELTTLFSQKFDNYTD